VKPFILGAALLAMCACTNGLHSRLAASQIYLLRVTGAPPATRSAAPPTATLQVALPFAGPGLESEHIALVEPEHRMSFYSGSLWAAPLPVLIETLVVQTLRGTGAWGAVNDSEGIFASEYFLQINIRRFEAEYTSVATPTVKVSFDCALGRRASREHLASFSVDAEASASANRVSAVVAAFEQATNAALAQLAERSQLAIKSSPAPSTP
jgi:cholesterol transport system auxiliary component